MRPHKRQPLLSGNNVKRLWANAASASGIFNPCPHQYAECGLFVSPAKDPGFSKPWASVWFALHPAREVLTTGSWALVEGRLDWSPWRELSFVSVFRRGRQLWIHGQFPDFSLTVVVIALADRVGNPSYFRRFMPLACAGSVFDLHQRRGRAPVWRPYSVGGIGDTSFQIRHHQSPASTSDVSALARVSAAAMLEKAMTKKAR